MSDMILTFVLHWLAPTATLCKEFEKNKLGNIRLRALPVLMSK